MLGRSRPVPSKTERLFAMSTAYVAIETQLGLTADKHAGITFKPVESSYFDQMRSELKDLLDISTKETNSTYETRTDSYGYQWIILQDTEFENLVATLHVVSEELLEQGFGDQLLAAVFKFDASEHGRTLYWLYNYKRGAFYPLAPTGKRQRDNAYELRMSNAMSHELPVEQELERWYPMWDIPF